MLLVEGMATSLLGDFLPIDAWAGTKRKNIRKIRTSVTRAMELGIQRGSRIPSYATIESRMIMLLASPRHHQYRSPFKGFRLKNDNLLGPSFDSFLPALTISGSDNKLIFLVSFAPERL